MSWRLAYSLVTLRDQVNAAYPNRSKVSDGTIGDAAHASSASDHNPNPAGVVCALDLTHDPANGFDAHALAEHLRLNRHPNLKYIISNARITGTHNNWTWEPSSGHYQHIHISVGVGYDGQSSQPYDDTTPWNIKGGAKMIENETQNNLVFLVAVGRNAGTSEKGRYIGKTWEFALNDMLKNSDRTGRVDIAIREYPKLMADPAAQRLEQIKQIVNR